jgi:hypothetical protein
MKKCLPEKIVYLILENAELYAHQEIGKQLLKIFYTHLMIFDERLAQGTEKPI